MSRKKNGDSFSSMTAHQQYDYEDGGVNWVNLEKDGWLLSLIPRWSNTRIFGGLVAQAEQKKKEKKPLLEKIISTQLILKTLINFSPK